MIVNWWHRRQGADVRTVDERFTDFADRVSEAMGRWRTSALCLVLIAIWGAFGPYTGYSDSWQLWVNTPTTIVELFLGLFTLAAANRVEKRNWQLHQQMARTLSRVDTVTAEENDEIKTGDQKLAAMQVQLDRIEMTEQTREAVDSYIGGASTKPGEFLFGGHRGRDRPITTRQYAGWSDERSMRRTPRPRSS